MGKQLSKDGKGDVTEDQTTELEVPREQTPTVLPVNDFNAETDAEKLNKALQAFGNNESTVTGILANRSWEQRQEIRDNYRSTYSKLLLTDIDHNLSGHYRDALEGLLVDPDTFRAYYINKILNDKLMTILPCTRGKDIAILETIYPLTKTELQGLKFSYEKVYGNPLLKDIEENITGHLKDWIVLLVKKTRNQGLPSPVAVAKDVNYLKNLSVDQWNTKTDALTKLFVEQSHFYLFSVCNIYQLGTGTTLLELVEKMDSDVRETYKVILGSCLDGYQFFSDGLYQSMKGVGTNDEKLIYIMIDRCETDLGNIKVAFQIKYNQTLRSFIKDDTSGDYKNLLLAILD